MLTLIGIAISSSPPGVKPTGEPERLCGLTAAALSLIEQSLKVHRAPRRTAEPGDHQRVGHLLGEVRRERRSPTLAGVRCLSPLHPDLPSRSRQPTWSGCHHLSLPPSCTLRSFSICRGRSGICLKRRQSPNTMMASSSISRISTSAPSSYAFSMVRAHAGLIAFYGVKDLRLTLSNDEAYQFVTDHLAGERGGESLAAGPVQLPHLQLCHSSPARAERLREWSSARCNACGNWLGTRRRKQQRSRRTSSRSARDNRGRAAVGRNLTFGATGSC
jgi:hypothetical protein